MARCTASAALGSKPESPNCVFAAESKRLGVVWIAILVGGAVSVIGSVLLGMYLSQSVPFVSPCPGTAEAIPEQELISPIFSPRVTPAIESHVLPVRGMFLYLSIFSSLSEIVS
jgi:hypothetical protein